jgi:hypothetical protein
MYKSTHKVFRFAFALLLAGCTTLDILLPAIPDAAGEAVDMARELGGVDQSVAVADLAERRDAAPLADLLQRPDLLQSLDAAPATLDLAPLADLAPVPDLLLPVDLLQPDLVVCSPPGGYCADVAMCCHDPALVSGCIAHLCCVRDNAGAVRCG